MKVIIDVYGGDQGWLTQQSYDVCPLGYAGYQSYLIDAKAAAGNHEHLGLPGNPGQLHASKEGIPAALFHGIEPLHSTVSQQLLRRPPFGFLPLDAEQEVRYLFAQILSIFLVNCRLSRRLHRLFQCP